MTTTPKPLILTPDDLQDYRLLDSGLVDGVGRKLEEVGGYRFIRPEAQAVWPPALAKAEWQKNIAGEFITSKAQTANNDTESAAGAWRLAPDTPATWPMQYDGITFNAAPTPFRHFGFFPEQAAHWQACAEAIAGYVRRKKTAPRILNLFGYTGIASLHAAKHGAEVAHVDSSKKAIAAAFANRDLAGMEAAPIRFITEDARAFTRREARRGKTYHGIILDPPKYGRGSKKGEIWHWERDIAALLADCMKILDGDALFVVLTSYAIRSSSLALHHALEAALAARGGGGNMESGELALREDNKRGFLLSQAIFARWFLSG